MSDIATPRVPGAWLASLYGGRSNPYDRKLLISSKVAENAGYAQPFIYAMMGAEMAKSEQWDDDMQAQINTYLQKKAEIEAAKDKREALKFQQETMKESLANANALWDSLVDQNGNPLPDRERGQAVIERINPLLVQAGMPPLSGFAKGNGALSFEAVVQQDADGRWVTKQGYFQNGKLFMQSGVDDQGKPTFMPAPEGAMTLKDYLAWQKGTEPSSDFALFYKAMKANGMSDAEISSEWETRKVRIANASRPSAGPKEESRTPDMKELDQINADRRKTGQPELTLEQWKSQKSDMNDPYGIKQFTKNKLQEKQGASAVAPAAPVVPRQTPPVELPPVPGAQKAPDGKWYVRDPRSRSGWSQVVQ